MIKTEYKKELTCDTLPKKKGDFDNDCRRVQEWINLQKYHYQDFNISISIDDDFGGGTEAGVKAFQTFQNLDSTGVVDEATWQHLVAPMNSAFTRLNFSSGTSIQDRVVQYAKNQLLYHPVELKSNLGPWIRAYCFGKDGSAYAWCAGFVTSIVDLAAEFDDKEVRDYMKASLSCDRILDDAISGKRGQTHLRNNKIKSNATDVKPGDLFLVINKRNEMDATHIGIVIGMNGTVMTTIEGNTNDEGSRDGYEVCQRFRDLSKGNYDIIKLK